MQDTGLHYVTYDPDALWQAMTEAYVAAGGEVLYPGNEKEIMLRAVQQILMQAFAGIDNGLRQATLRYAVREYLDLLGEKRSCPRIEAEAATATVEITFSASGVSDTLAEGEAITADGVMLYTLDETVEDDGTARAVTVKVTCGKAGAAGNGLTAGTHMQAILRHDGVQDIVCTVAASGGQDREKDDAYRERIRTKAMMSVTTGTSESYRSAAMAVSSVIVDANAVLLDELEVCVYLLLSDETGSAALIEAVEAALSPKDTRPMSDHVSAALVTKKSYTLNVQYWQPQGSAITEAAEAAAAAYSEWQDHTIGQAFNPDMLVSMLYQAGATRVAIASGSAFDGGSCVYTEIDPDEACSGTVTLEAMT